MILLQNLKWGLRWGVTMAVGFTAIGLIGSIASYFDGKPTSGMPLGSLVVFYFIAGVCGGLLLGLLRPLTRYKVGAIFLVIVVVASCLSLLRYLHVAADRWQPIDTFLVVFGSLLGGPVAALVMLHIQSDEKKGSSDLRDLDQ